MADLGTIGYARGFGAYGGRNPLASRPQYVRGVRGGSAWSDFMPWFAGKSTSEGNPQPSLYMQTDGVFRFKWAVAAGENTIQISVKQPSNGTPRPRMVVKANPDIGLDADLTGDAASGTGWTTIGPLTVDSDIGGAVWVELHARQIGQFVPCYWDNIVTT